MRWRSAVPCDRGGALWQLWWGGSDPPPRTAPTLTSHRAGRSTAGALGVDLYDLFAGGIVARRLGRALARLPAGDRDVLLLHTFADLDYAGISEALDIPVGTVRSRLNRARGKLRTAIAPAVDEDNEETYGRNLAPAPSAD